MAVFANVYNQSLWLQEAWEPGSIQLRNGCLSQKALPLVWSMLHQLSSVAVSVDWSFVVLSSNTLHFCCITFLCTKPANENIAQFLISFSNIRVRCFEFGQFWQLVFSPRELPLVFWGKQYFWSPRQKSEENLYCNISYRIWQ